jgi:hypothetical protein
MSVALSMEKFIDLQLYNAVWQIMKSYIGILVPQTKETGRNP